MKGEIRVSLSFEDLKTLLSGRVLETTGMSKGREERAVFVIQQDVGFDMMLSALQAAIQEARDRIR